MPAPFNLTMFKTIKEERQRLNSIRKKINYVVLPVYVVSCVALLVPMIWLMEIDDEKYLPVFLALFGVFVLMTAALFISLPFIRKKEAAIELEKYDFHLKSAEPRGEYVFGYSELAATFPLSPSPFEEFKNENATFSGTSGLRKLLDYYGINIESGKLYNYVPEYGAVSVGDYTEDARYTNFYAKTHGESELEIYDSYTVVINENGLSVNDIRFSLENARVKITTLNLFMQVHIYLNLLFEEEELYVSLRLSKDVLAIIEKFSISVENRKLLDFIINDPQTAFKEILKRGRISEKTLNKYSR